MKKLLAVCVVGMVLFVGCTPSGSNAQSQGQATTEAYFKKLQAAVPYPLGDMNDSLERRQLRERLLRFNKPTKIAYISLLSNNGSVIASFPVKGKVSGVNSQMTADQIVTNGGNSFNTSDQNVTVNAPQDDGSYGTNGNAVFFFTTAGVYMEWNGLYLLTDAPLQITSAPVVVLPANAKPSSTSGK